MRITLQLLWKHAQEPLEEVELLDLSGINISAIEELQHCPSLQSLILCNNRISVLHNIASCHQLWSINLTGNRVKSLHGLSKFPVLGSLKLSCNELEWAELPRLSHMTLLSLTLSGNPQLDSDPYYREHVVDILPNVWVLDNRLVTASERRQVAQFFLKSETSPQPVWRKATEKVFVPTFMKDLLVNGVFGERTTHLMAHFPASYTHNTEMDRRRLHYLAHTLEQDIKLHFKYSKEGETVAVPELCRMMESRDEGTEQSTTMLLILLLAHLEYSLPHEVLMETLKTAKLSKIGDVVCVGVFDLPSQLMMGVATLLLGAAAIDRQNKKEGGVYNKLFAGLNSALDSQQRKSAATVAGRPLRDVRSLQQREEQAQLRCLVASEVVQLLCLVPQFCMELTTHPGLLQLVCVATSNPRAGDVISNMTWKVQARGGSEWDMYNVISTFLVNSTSDVVQGRRRRGFPSRQGRHGYGIHHTTSQLLPSTKPHPSSVLPRASSANPSSHPSPERPHPQLGLVVLDQFRSYWKTDDLQSDLSEIPLQSLSVDPGPVSRETTPDLIHPNSETHFLSEVDLHHMPSEPELESGNEVAGPPMRVEITESRPPSSKNPHTHTDEAMIEHQKKVLARFTRGDFKPTPTPTPPPSPPHTLTELTIPTPQVHLPEKWEHSKSLVSCTTSKQHSCQDTPPYPPRPPPSPSPPPLPHTKSIVDFLYPSSVSAGNGAVVSRPAPPSITAWSPVRSLPRPRQNLLSSARLMNRREVSPSHTKHRATSAPAWHQRPERVVGGGGTTTVILKPKTTKTYQSSPPRHMRVYAANSSMRPSGKHHFTAAHTSPCKALQTRPLGDLRTLYVGGTSIT